MVRVLYLFLFFTLLFIIKPQAQDTSIATKSNTILRGFVTGLGYVRFSGNLKQSDLTQLLHNRIILDAQFSKGFTLRLDLRNRIYHGNDVRSIPSFPKMLRNTNEGFDLQKAWISSESLVAHTNIDRFCIDKEMGRWNLRLGRQRINWGLTTLWNPNDVFNSYNFLDFDYEERPGVDAIKVSYASIDLSEFDLAAAKLSGNQYAFATRYFFNRKGYDIQFNLGTYRGRPSAGWGCAGGLGDQGFKCEIQYFFKEHDHPGVLNAVVELDRILKKERFILFAFMYNSNGRVRAVNDPLEINFQATPEQMMPGRWNLSGMFSKKWTPLFSGSVSMVYAPGIDLLILLPRLSYSLTENIASDLLIQSFSLRYFNRFAAWQHIPFLRVKYNF